jgi:hypothetical protein
MPEIRRQSPGEPRAAKTNARALLGSAGFLGGPGHSPLPAMEGSPAGWLEDGASRV